MLFFRSEELARHWCTERGTQLNPVVTMPQLWGLATTWYSTRLQRNARRPQPDEILGIFAGLGLEGDFWDPKADRFGPRS